MKNAKLTSNFRNALPNIILSVNFGFFSKKVQTLASSMHWTLRGLHEFTPIYIWECKSKSSKLWEQVLLRQLILSYNEVILSYEKNIKEYSQNIIL